MKTDSIWYKVDKLERSHGENSSASLQVAYLFIDVED